MLRQRNLLGNLNWLNSAHLNNLVEDKAKKNSYFCQNWAVPFALFAPYFHQNF